MQAREDWIDIAKGIGILLVVYGHVARGIQAAGLPIDQGFFQFTDSLIYSFHMPLFFLIAGIHLEQSVRKRGLTMFAANKFDTLIYPYVIWSVLHGLIEVVASRHTNHPTHLADVFKLATEPRAHFWFLYALFFASIFTAFWLNLRVSFNWLLALILTAALYVMRNHLESGVVAVSLTMGVSIFLVSGDVLRRVLACVLPFMPVILIVMVLAFVGETLGGSTEVGVDARRMTLAQTGSLSVIAFSVLIGGRAADMLQYLGKQSMVIYLLHVLFASAGRIFLQKFGHVSNPTLHVIIGMAIGLAGPLVAGILIHRLKVGFVFKPPRLLSLEHRLVKRGA